LLIDAYNANPSSMQAALENFATLPTHPKAVILGDMLELGVESRQLHISLLGKLDNYGFDKILLCGQQFEAAGSAHQCFPDIEALSRYLSINPLQDYHILIKGSHGIHLENIINFL
jgi:UDP-N-acetylmuramoyl-tripeptide--D-alanyl-D-alanine ligase